MLLCRSAYSLFYQCARKQLIVEFPDLSGKEIPGVCSELWKNLPEAERALWQADAENDRLRYQRECALLAQENEILDSKSGALEKQPFDLHQDSPMSSAVEERMKPTARRKYAKSVKKDRMENPPKARKTSKKQFPESNSMFQNSQPHNDERNYFTPRSHDGNEDDPASALFGNDDPLKIPSHDSLFDDSLAYDANLFFDSDPFHADLDLFAGLSSPTSNRHLDSKPFLHEDLSLFGNESTSNFSL